MVFVLFHFLTDFHSLKIMKRTFIMRAAGKKKVGGFHDSLNTNSNEKMHSVHLGVKSASVPPILLGSLIPSGSLIPAEL